MSSMDLSKFSDDDFDAKTWINECFASLDKGDGDDSGNGSMWTKGSGSSITPAEQLAGTGIMKLQLSIQELSSSLEDSCQQMLQSVPRIVRELDAVQQVAHLSFPSFASAYKRFPLDLSRFNPNIYALSQESKILQDQMKLVKDDIQRVEQDTAHSMEQLLALDCVKGEIFIGKVCPKLG